MDKEKFSRRPRRPKLERVNLSEPRDHEKFEEPESDEYDTDSDEDFVRNSNRSNQTENVKFPPINVINRFVQDQLISIMEENTVNESSASYDNFRHYGSNPNSPVSPELRLLARNSVAKSFHSEHAHQGKRSLLRPYKPLGPDPLPARQPKIHMDDIRARKSYYDSLSTAQEAAADDDDDYFEFNDFIVDNSYNQRLVASCVRTISKYNYRQICRMLEDKIQEEKKSV